ncbi:MAG: LPP20 family lipoprotein [Proteobacteria bacterium]|nr:LPP20 family lipoprotein [Pseudomonadota bacterium]
MKIKWFLIIGLIVGMFFLTVPTGFCDDQGSMAQQAQFVEPVGDNGSINWSTGVIEAVGIGAPPKKYFGLPQARPLALRAAKVDAYRNLLEVVKGVQVTATTMVANFAVESDIIRTRVEGMVRGAQIVKKEYLSDGTVEVTMRMSMSGGLVQIMLPRVMEIEQAGRPVAPTPPGYAPAAPAAPAGPVYTGLVIDARGISARPAMSPKVVDEDGREVYGSMQVDREFAVQQGMSGYARDLTAAQSNPRVTNNPITIKGLSTKSPGQANIVISNADAQMIRAAAENLAFLKKCRVMIVLD